MQDECGEQDLALVQKSQKHVEDNKAGRDIQINDPPTEEEFEVSVTILLCNLCVNSLTNQTLTLQTFDPDPVTLTL